MQLIDDILDWNILWGLWFLLFLSWGITMILFMGSIGGRVIGGDMPWS